MIWYEVDMASKRRPPPSELLRTSAEELPTAYKAFFEDIKRRVQSSQIKAALAVNRELILLYYDLGKQILERQNQQGWGAYVIDRLAVDLRYAFPEMSGFSTRNLKYMRAFAETYPDEEFVQQLAAQIPWGHQMCILDKAKTAPEREFYIRQTFEYGWSRNVLVHHMESRLFERQGKALHNFTETLPPLQSDLAQQILKDPYAFDFLTQAQGLNL